MVLPLFFFACFAFCHFGWAVFSLNESNYKDQYLSKESGLKYDISFSHTCLCTNTEWLFPLSLFLFFSFFNLEFLNKFLYGWKDMGFSLICDLQREFKPPIHNSLGFCLETGKCTK